MSTRFQSLSTDGGKTRYLCNVHRNAVLLHYKKRYNGIVGQSQSPSSETAQVSQTEAFLETLEQDNADNVHSNNAIETLKSKVRLILYMQSILTCVKQYGWCQFLM